MSDETPSQLLSFSHSCEAFETRLDGWFDLEEEQRLALRRESRRCADCSAALETQRALDDLVGEARSEIDLAVSGESQMARRTDEAEVPARRVEGASRGSLLPLAAAALLTLTVAFVWSLVDTREGVSEKTERRAVVEAPVLPTATPPAASMREEAVERPTPQPEPIESASTPQLAETLPPPALAPRTRPPLPSASAASAALRSVPRPRLQAMRPPIEPGRVSFRVPTAPSRSNLASGR